MPKACACRRSRSWSSRRWRTRSRRRCARPSARSPTSRNCTTTSSSASAASRTATPSSAGRTRPRSRSTWKATPPPSARAPGRRAFTPDPAFSWRSPAIRLGGLLRTLTVGGASAPISARPPPAKIGAEAPPTYPSKPCRIQDEPRNPCPPADGPVAERPGTSQQPPLTGSPVTLPRGGRHAGVSIAATFCREQDGYPRRAARKERKSGAAPGLAARDDVVAPHQQNRRQRQPDHETAPDQLRLQGVALRRQQGQREGDDPVRQRGQEHRDAGVLVAAQRAGGTHLDAVGDLEDRGDEQQGNGDGGNLRVGGVDVHDGFPEQQQAERRDPH